MCQVCFCGQKSRSLVVRAGCKPGCFACANKARDYRAKQVAAKRGGGQVPLSLQAEDDEGNRLIDPASTLPSPDGEMMRDARRLVGEVLHELGGRVRKFWS